MKRYALTILFAALASVCVLKMTEHAAAQGKKAPASAAPPVIDKERIREHVKFLSSDELEGRGTGQRGGDLAADYIAKQFASYGLKPAGDDGTFYQNVPMVGVGTLPETNFSFIEAGAKSFEAKNLTDFVTNNESQTETADIHAPIVFVRLWIQKPGYAMGEFQT